MPTDYLVGGDGNDYLNGNHGDDYLTGGEGADTFVIQKHHRGKDTIIDFTDDTDIIMLKGLSLDDVRIGSRSLEGNVVIEIKGGYSVTLLDLDDSTVIDAEDFTVM
ncbi:MAG: hypothetical protein GDA48_13685 [Hormoscilla sp. GM102CHS1]|nr:hypothetical protein [Hormoscilla sp. GM102CHS1]